MTIKEIIIAKLKRFGVTLSDEDYQAIIVEFHVNGDVSYGPQNEIEVKKAMVGIIPEIMSMQSVSEGGFSIQWNVEGLKAYHAGLCNELGVKNVLKPVLKNASNRW